ncbi:MAG: TetR/AcrR family transcriptional regulator [Arenicellales bacterium]|jgi:AcrR family transcriptional regulator
MSKTAKKRGSPASRRLTREHWVATALDILIKYGVERVKVLPLAGKLGVTRGSFYWHFNNRKDLLDSLLEFWDRKNTRGIVEQAAHGGSSIIDSVLSVFEIWTNEDKFDPQLDFAVREWARRSTRVRAIVEQADAERVEALKRMFLRAGTPDAEAFIRARVLYYMQIGYFAPGVRESLDRRIGYVDEYLRVFTGVEPRREAVNNFTRRALRGEFSAPSKRRRRGGKS